ncbi:hypothetical protein Drorol1_Dr00002633 [Drosera rotundifolia]
MPLLYPFLICSTFPRNKIKENTTVGNSHSHNFMENNTFSHNKIKKDSALGKNHSHIMSSLSISICPSLPFLNKPSRHHHQVLEIGNKIPDNVVSISSSLSSITPTTVIISNSGKALAVLNSTKQLTALTSRDVVVVCVYSKRALRREIDRSALEKLKGVL